MPDVPTALTILGGVIAGKPLLDAAGDALKRSVGPTADVLGQTFALPLATWHKKRVERAQRVVDDAARMLDEGGKSARPVPGRILWPLLEKASVEEEDDELRQKWTALLANAADLAAATQVLPAFSTILSELGPVEARILEWYYNNLTAGSSRRPYLTMAGQMMFPYSTHEMYFKQFTLDADSAGAVDFNLRRLELIEVWDTREAIATVTDQKVKLVPGTLPEGTKPFMLQISTTHRDYRVFTPLGYLFIKACLPPGTPDPQERFKQKP